MMMMIIQVKIISWWLIQRSSRDRVTSLQKNQFSSISILFPSIDRSKDTHHFSRSWLTYCNSGRSNHQSWIADDDDQESRAGEKMRWLGGGSELHSHNVGGLTFTSLIRVSEDETLSTIMDGIVLYWWWLWGGLMIYLYCIKIFGYMKILWWRWKVGFDSDLKKSSSVQVQYKYSKISRWMIFCRCFIEICIYLTSKTFFEPHSKIFLHILKICYSYLQST